MANGHDCNGILIGAVSATAARAEGGFNAFGDVNWNLAIGDGPLADDNVRFVQLQRPGARANARPAFSSGRQECERTFHEQCT